MTTVVESPPDDATVTAYDDPALANDTAVKRLIDRTLESGGFSEDLERTAYDALQAELADVSRYDGAAFGYYFEREGTVVRFRLLVEE